MCCVRPGVLDTYAKRTWLHNVLIALDLPALLRPTKAISAGVSGRSFKWFTVVKNWAFWNRLFMAVKICEFGIEYHV